jgi:hypothetical protein
MVFPLRRKAINDNLSPGRDHSLASLISDRDVVRLSENLLHGERMAAEFYVEKISADLIFASNSTNNLK